MPLPSQFEALKRPLRQINFVLARAIVLSIATAVVVTGVSTLVHHLLRPETIARVRLERDGYAVNEAAAFEAVSREDPLALVRLKIARVSLLGTNEEGWTPYEMALRSDRLAMLDTLAGLKAVPTLKPAVLEQLLVEALRRGALETAEFLLERKASPDVEMEPGMPALVWAISADREKAVDLLIRHKAKIEAASKLGTPLVLAYTQDKFPMFDRLLTLGAEPDQRDLAGRMVGVAAIQDGRDAYTRRLLSAGVDANAKGADGISMLEAAFRKRTEPLFVELVKAGGALTAVDGQRRTYLERAATDRDYHWMELLLKQGVSPNERTAGKGDSLWWSCFEVGDPAGAELLLGAGADINAPDGAGVTPIDLAIQRDSFRVTRYLFGRGAKTLDTVWDPLRSGNYDMLRLLLANGAAGSNAAEAGMTPLAFAIRHGDVTGAALLLEYGARVQGSERPDGHSLLEWAMAHQHLPIIESLVKQGANVNDPVARPQHPDFLACFKENGNLQYHLKGDSNVTPLMVLAGSHQLEAARFLLKNGAKRNQSTRRNRTYPVTFAIRAQNLPMAQLMLGREPEVDGKYQRKVVVNRSEQRARFYKHGELVYSTRCSTGKSGYRTPSGTFVITDKTRLRYSTLYGSAMPFFHRLSGSAIGMHQGYVPGYPASHGCIRLPYEYAKVFYQETEVGDIVVVE